MFEEDEEGRETAVDQLGSVQRDLQSPVCARCRLPQDKEELVYVWKACIAKWQCNMALLFPAYIPSLES